MHWNLPGLPESKLNREVMNFSFFTVHIAMGERTGINTHLLLICSADSLNVSDLPALYREICSHWQQSFMVQSWE